MRHFILTLALFISSHAWSQKGIDPIIYADLHEYQTFFYGEPNELGYYFLASPRVIRSDSTIKPGLLIQIDHGGEIIKIDTLREYVYHFIHKVDSFYFLGAFHYYKFPDTSMTYVLEICDLHGQVIHSYYQDFIDNIPFVSGMAQLNDSIFFFGQSCQILNNEPASVFYRINVKSLDVDIQLADKGVIFDYVNKVDNQPTYLQWILGIWILDTTFTATNKLTTDTTQASYSGKFLPREDMSGWVGFGSCITPSNFYGICLIALNENLEFDFVDLIYHSPSSNLYSAASGNPICKNIEAYYAVGNWDVTPSPLNYFNITTPTEIVIVKYDLQLNKAWTKIIGGDRRYVANQIQPTVTGGFKVSGTLLDNLNNNLIAPFAMFFDADGELVGTEEVAPPGRYEFTIYGNPGREALRILARFEERHMRLQVVDVMGRPILSELLSEGMNHFDTAWWPSGTYFIVITNEQGRALWSQPWVRE